MLTFSSMHITCTSSHRSTAPHPSLRKTQASALDLFESYNDSTGCYGTDTKVKVEVMTDRFGNDTSWEITYYYTVKKLLG